MRPLPSFRMVVANSADLRFLTMSLLVLQAVGPVAVTSLLLGSGIPGIIDAPVQDNPNDPKNQHAQDVYNHAAIQVPMLACA